MKNLKKTFLVEWIVAIALGFLGVGSAFGRNIGDAYMAVYTCLASDGTPVEGQNVTLKIQKASNGYWFDFNDSAFKNESWGNKSVSLAEDTTEHQYYYSWTPPAGETAPEQYLYVYDNANTTYKDHQIERVDYQAIGNSTFAGGAVASVTGAVGSVTGNVGGNLVGNVGGNVNGSTASVVGNVGGNLIGNVGGNVNGSVASVVGNVGGNLGGNVNGSVASVASAVDINSNQDLTDTLSNITAVKGYVDTEVADTLSNVSAVKAKTDKLTFDDSNRTIANSTALNLSLGY